MSASNQARDTRAEAAAAQKDLQSTLLRSTIICATSMQSLRETVQPETIAADAAQLPPPASQLSAQILNDLVQMFTMVQKHSNALSLALRPSASSTRAEITSATKASATSSDSFSPVSDLDASSLDAAKAQIVSLSSDLIPKIVFLAKKTWKDRKIFQVDTELAAKHAQRQQEERNKLDQLASEMGGKVMTSAQLGLDSPASAASLKKLVACSLGEAFAREIRSAVEDVLGCIAELLQSFLDTRTRAALQLASNARDKADGLPSRAASSAAAQSPKSIQEARRKSLELNNLVWETCTKYIGKRAADGSPTTATHVDPNGNKVKVQAKGLSRDNLEASKRIWQERVAIMRDGLDEMKQAADGDDSPAAGPQQRQPAGLVDDDDLDLGEELSTLPTLSMGERKQLSQLSNLVKVGNILHENTLKAIVAAHGNTESSESPLLDLDKVDELARELEEAQDELVAAALYGEEDAGLEELDLGDDEDEDEDEENPAVEEGSLEAAMLRTLQQYVRAAVVLRSYVSGDKQLVDKVDAVAQEPVSGDFEQIFEARFSKLSKVLTDASSKVQVRSTSQTEATDGRVVPAAPQTKTVDSSKAQPGAAGVVATAATATAAVVAPAAVATPATTSAPSQTANGHVDSAASSRRGNASFTKETFLQELEGIAEQLGNGTKAFDRAVAEQLDKDNPLAPLRDGYVLPLNRDVCHRGASASGGVQQSGEEGPDATALYMCGNSLGPLPKLTKQYLAEELDAWGRKAVLGHFDHPYGRPWTQLEDKVCELTADLVGAKRAEVTVMGTLTGNLHSLLATFYRPAVKPFGVRFKGDVEEARKRGDKVRHKIVYEHKAFPSDCYALASAIELNGFDVATSLVPLKPKGDSRTLETADILATIDELGEEGETCLVLFGGIQYFTGQFFELSRIAAKAREHGILFGVDLAHAFANVPLRLHDWGVDFACFCTYKFSSSGPGGIAGLFVHEKWTPQGSTEKLTRQAGWWGHDRATRFSMPEEYTPIAGADGWQVSNPSMLDMTALRGSLETLQGATKLAPDSQCGAVTREGEVGEGQIMPILRYKSLRLTSYLESLLLRPGFLPSGLGIEIVTPRDPQQRGSQLCIRIPDQREAFSASAAAVATSSSSSSKKKKKKKKDGVEEEGGVVPPIQSTRLIARAHARAEKERGLVTDIRHPDMLRIAPLAQFSSFTEVWRTAEALRVSIVEEMELEAGR